MSPVSGKPGNGKFLNENWVHGTNNISQYYPELHLSVVLPGGLSQKKYLFHWIFWDKQDLHKNYSNYQKSWKKWQKQQANENYQRESSEKKRNIFKDLCHSFKDGIIARSKPLKAPEKNITYSKVKRTCRTRVITTQTDNFSRKLQNNYLITRWYFFVVHPVFNKE